MLEIVAGVDDDEQVLGRHDARQAQGELGAPYPAGQGDDHWNRSSSGGRTRSATGTFGRLPGQATHDDDRLRLRRLTLQQRRGGGNLIGETDDADFQHAAEQVGLAAQVDHRRQAGASRSPHRRCRDARGGRNCR